MEPTPTDLQGSYDRVAAEYAERFRREMDHKPFDRKMLDWLAERVGGAGAICDVGCGPGQIAAYLRTRSAETCGIDLSPEMVKQAQRLNPDITFRQGNMLSLTGISDNAFGGAAAFYSIIHVPRPAVVDALRELRRVVRPNGTLLLAFHLGQEIRHLDVWWDKPVSLDFIFFESAEMRGYLQAAGFEISEIIERDPYPDIEVQTRRAYIFARKP